MKKLNLLNISVWQLRLNKIEKLFYNNEGVKSADKGKYNEAAAYFTKAISITPDDSLSYFNRATVKVDLGDILGAKLDFKLSESYQLSSIRYNKLEMN